MDKAKDEDFMPALIVGFYKGNPAVRTLDVKDGLTSTQIAGFMTAILDCMVDMVDEKDQNQFERNVLAAFEIFVENRFANTHKYKIEEE